MAINLAVVVWRLGCGLCILARSITVRSAHPSVPGMGMDLQSERRLPESVTITVVKPKVWQATAVLEEG